MLRYVSYLLLAIVSVLLPPLGLVILMAAVIARHQRAKSAQSPHVVIIPQKAKRGA